MYRRRTAKRDLNHDGFYQTSSTFANVLQFKRIRPFASILSNNPAALKATYIHMHACMYKMLKCRTHPSGFKNIFMSFICIKLTITRKIPKASFFNSQT
jgi:hypothetical protein